MRKTDFTLKLLRIRSKISLMAFLKKMPIQELLLTTIV